MSSLLSVVVPTRNRADHVEQAIVSVLSQALPKEVSDLEVVVVDDASDDSTPQLLDRLSATDRRISVVRNERALGPCDARNRGLEQARGELVGFCDDDDAWLPGAASELLGFVEFHPAVGVVTSWHIVHHVELGRDARYRGPLDYTNRGLLWQNFVALPFGIIRRAMFSFEPRFDPQLVTGEDWDLWLRCAREHPIRTVPHFGYRYTQHARPRVTRTDDAQVVGRRHFLAKHFAEMSPSCRLFHEAVLAGLEAGRSASAETLKVRGGYSRPERAFASLVLSSSSAASRLGQRRSDPGLQARLVARVVERNRPARTQDTQTPPGVVCDGLWISRGTTDSDAAFAAALHASEITSGFLSSLGTGFLKRLYRRIARHDSSFLFVAHFGGERAGFIAGSADVKGLYSSFVLRDSALAAGSAIRSLLRSWPRAAETLRHGIGDSSDAEDEPELLAVAVTPRFRGRGVGRALVAAFVHEAEATGARSARVVVGADNEAAIEMYRSAGFEAAKEHELHPGTVSLLMRRRSTAS